MIQQLDLGLDAPVPVIGYGLGVAAGTLLGLCLEERASRGGSGVLVVAPVDGNLLERLDGLGWPATWFFAEGPRGSVTVAFVAVDDAHARHVVGALQAGVPDAFLTVQRLNTVHASQLGQAQAVVTSLDRRPRRSPVRQAPSATRTKEKTHDENRHAGAA